MLKCKGAIAGKRIYRANLVLFHWSGGDANSWSAQIKEFEKDDICCWTFTLPGRTVAHTQTDSVERLADMCVLALKMELATNNTLRELPLTLLGHRCVF